MKRPQIFPLCVLAWMTLSLVGCGGGGGGSTPPTPPTPPAAISVALSPAPPTSLNTAATASLTAVVSNDSSGSGVKWTVTCTAATGSTCGSFSAATTASGAATTYTAPSAVPSPATVTITATSAADGTKSASATITIAAVAPSISVTFAAAPPANLAAGASTSVTANVANDSKNAGVTWTVTCTTTAPATCGSFSAATTASGTATTYTAPATAPSPATVTVTATSVTDTTKSVSATITIGPAAPPILANGTYVYHISGEDSTGPYFIVGAFILQNGVITAGEQDFSDRSNGYTTVFPSGAPGSSISMVGSNVQITINTGNTSIGVSGVETLRGPKVSATRVLLSEFDTFASGSGSLDLQTSTAAPSGGYAFSIGGIDGTSNGFALAVGGVLNISGTTISIAGSVLDYNDGGNVGQALTLTSGTITAPDSVGRVSIAVTPNSTALASFVLTGYIVGTNRIQLVESQTDTLNADQGGTALGQGANTGTFTQGGVANTTYVFASTGADASGTLNISASLTLGSAGALAGLIALNDIAVAGAQPITGGTYAVDPTGRITFSNVLPSLVNGTPFAFELYLDGNGNAMELGVDSSSLSSGAAYKQSNATVSPSGNFGLTGFGFGNVNNTAPGWSGAGPATVSSSGNVTGYTDYNVAGTTPISNAALTGTVTSSSTMMLTGLNAASATASNGYVFFSIDGSRFLAIEDDGAQLGILQLETIRP